MLVAVVAVAGLTAACTSAERQVDVDGGSSGVVVLGDIRVSARPGQKVILRNTGASTHAFVGPGGELSRLFVPQAGGLVPNPSVWGPSHDAEAWDGRSHWSTGAMGPSELREIQLAEDIEDGDHILSCALHPALRVVLRVGGEDGRPPPDAEEVVSKARRVVEDQVEGSRVTVTAGLYTGDAYVAAFSPRIARVPVGGSVTWRAATRTPVDVVFGARPSLANTVPPDGLPIGKANAWNGSGVLRSGFLSTGPSDTGATAEEWTVTFTKAGTYTYASRFGDAMTGTVVVGP